MFSAFCFRSAWMVLFTSATLSAAELDVESLQERIYSTIESVKPAVVAIQGGGVGFSGVIVSKDGHVLSAGHAVSPGVRYQVLLPDGRRLRARGKGSNTQADCALLQITSKVDDLPFVQMGVSRTLARNQPCLSLSYPGGQGARGVPLVRFGRIVRNSRGRRMLQSTAAMQPGDSGGPLFDLEGRVIGIHSRIGLSMDRNYEVPVDTFKDFWSELNREELFVQSGPPVPRLGFQGADRRDGTGIEISKVIDDSLADKHGVKIDDVIQSVDGKATTSIRALRRVLIAARDDGRKEILVKVLREDKDIELKVAFDVDRDTAPKVDLPVYEEKDFPKPQRMDLLVNLAGQFSDLESELDDACVEISSTLADGDELLIVGTLIKETQFIVSKNSMVGSNPTFKNGQVVSKLEVVSRDKQNDLVLLKAPQVNSTGVDISMQVSDVASAGRFLITPDLKGAGLISVVGTRAFMSRKQQSRGYMGVMPASYKGNGGAVLQEVIEDGAAKRAGLQAGDIVTKLNETIITTHDALRRFLGTVDPNSTVVAIIKRDDEELEKTIKLGTFPSSSKHVADKMVKSDRRDGFSRVISHDADLKPQECGGPVFDLDGNFVGLNIARNSRVRSFLIPQSIVKKLVASRSE